MWRGFRLNASQLPLPESVRTSSAAMQVYPNSPNYDHETNEMVKLGSPTKRNHEAPAENSLAHTPHKMMEDSQRTARRLSHEAISIDRSVTKVASLIKPANASPVAAPYIKLQPSKAKTLPVALSDSPISPILKTPAPVVKSGGFLPLKLPIALPEASKFKAPSGGSFSPPKIAGGDFAPAKVPTGVKPKTSSFVSFPKPDLLTKKADPVTIDLSPPIRKPKSFNVKSLRPAKAIESPSKQFAPSLPSLRNEPQPQPSKTQPTSKAEQVDQANQSQPPTVETVSFDSKRWIVKQGDSFWSIAQESYGDGRFFRALYQTNRRLVPGFEDLSVGVEIDVPTMEQLIAEHPSLCPADAVHKNDPWRATPDDLMETLTDDCDSDLRQRLYETKAKDTLFSIAQRQLGQASRYVELIELNRFRIADDTDHQTLLPAGIELLLPDH